MTYTRNEEKIPFTVDGNSNRLIAFEYPMYSEYERLSIATKQSFDINGRGQSFQIPFSKDVYAMVFSTKKREISKLPKTFFFKSHKFKTCVLQDFKVQIHKLPDFSFVFCYHNLTLLLLFL